MITVYYDGKCGLCSKEIRYYQGIAPVDVFNWIDIASDSSAFETKGFNRSEGLKILHAEDAAGTMHLGVDAFIIIWRELKYWHYLSHVVGLLGIKQLARIVYNLFAKWRFSRLPHCQIALKQDQDRTNNV